MSQSLQDLRTPVLLQSRHLLSFVMETVYLRLHFCLLKIQKPKQSQQACQCNPTNLIFINLVY